MTRTLLIVGGAAALTAAPRGGPPTRFAPAPLRAAASEEPALGRRHFIREIVETDVEAGKHPTGIVTRFPPEPNGYLCVSIALNFGIARDYGGTTHMRLDDTNPDKEHPEYGAAILEDVKWLVGGDASGAAPWRGEVRHASDYFEALYNCCLLLIRRGLAYVDSQSVEEVKEAKGDWKTPGVESPFRGRSVEENLALFEAMRYGGPLAEAKNGSYPVLRAKIDMASPNMNLRDPALYRVKLVSHPRTAEAWRIYPMYDLAHAASDALEGITHSLCTLEFEDHRPLYDWVVDRLPELRDPAWVAAAQGPRTEGDPPPHSSTAEPAWPAPRQIEFSRLNVQYTLMSKRKLMRLVEDGFVDGWDDPRLPTLSAMRRRGVPPAAILEFCERIGISKAESNIDPETLDDCIRDVLDADAPRAFAVLRPLAVVIENWDDAQAGDLALGAPRHPKREDMGLRDNIRFGRDLLIDAADFHDADVDGPAPEGFNRLVPGGRVRLRYGYVIRCDAVDRDAANRAVRLRCSVEYDTRAGAKGGQARVKGIIHWLNAADAVPATARLFGRLFKSATTAGDPDDLAADSRIDLACFVEPDVAQDPRRTFQFERAGYFCLEEQPCTDAGDPGLVFNRIVGLRDSFGAKKGAQKEPAAAPPPLTEASKGAKASNEAEDPLPPALAAVTRLELLVGEITGVEPHPNSDDLWSCTVDCGGDDPRQIGAGLRAAYPDPADLKGQRVVVLANSKARKVAGVQSQGMIVGASVGASTVVVQAPATAEPGDRVVPRGFADATPATPNQLNNKKLWQVGQPALSTKDGAVVVNTDDGGSPLPLCTADGAGVCTAPGLPDGATIG